MQNFSRSLLVMLMASLVFMSCKSKSDIGAMIPADAVVAGYFDTKSLLDKLPYEDVKSTQLFQDMYADSTLPAWSKSVLDDPQKTGIDMSKGMVGYISKGTGDDYNLVLKGFINNAGDFESFNKNISDGKPVTAEKKFKSLELKHGGLVGWDNNHFMYVVNMQDPSQSPDDWQQEDNELPKMPKGSLEAAKEHLSADFNLPEDRSLAKDDRFSAMLKDKGDMKLWLNTEKMFSLSPFGVLGMLKLDALVKDSRSTYAVDFGKGNIAMDQKAYYGKEMRDLLKKYKGDDVKAAEFEKIPSNDIIGALAINLKPELLREILKLIGLDGMANMYLGQMNLKTDDIVNAINGKTLIALTDPKGSALDSLKPEQFDYKNLFSIGVKNKADMQKLIDAFLKAGGGVVPSELPYVLTDKEFVISNKKPFAEAYVAGKNDQKPEWASKVSGHPFGLYIDLQKMFAAMPDRPDTTDNKSLVASRAFWKNLYSTGGDFSGDALTVKTEVNLVNGDENALKQLNRYVDEMYRINKNRIKKMPADSDSLQIAPPIDSANE